MKNTTQESPAQDPRLVIQGQHCPDNAQGLVRTDAPTAHRTAVSVFFRLVSSMEWSRSLRGVDVSCAFLRGKPREVEDPLFFEPPSRGLLGIERGTLIEIVKGVFGLPDSPCGWRKELRDTLQGDPAFFCLRDFSGHLIGMVIVHVDDTLLTNNSHQAESHISRLISKCDIKDVKRDDDDGGCLVLWKTNSDCTGRYETGRSVSAARPDGVCESSLRTCQYASSPSPTRGSPVYDRRSSRGAKNDREFNLGNKRNMSRLVICDQSVAEETQRPWCPITSAPYKT